MISVSDWARSWARGEGVKPESAVYLKAVDNWRQAWRPKKVRILLVAESHVAEQEGDLEVRVKPPRGLRKKLPSQYVRLVYCLGYGEDSLCSQPPKPNPGTRQFWNIFGAIAAGRISNKQPRLDNSRLEERISWKLNVLRTLQSRDIWLVDASVAGLYSTDKGRLYRNPTCRKMIRESYERYVWPMVRKDLPDQVWVIGRGVGHALQGRPEITHRSIISQPQDRTPGRFQRDLARLVAETRTC